MGGGRHIGTAVAVPTLQMEEQFIILAAIDLDHGSTSVLEQAVRLGNAGQSEIHVVAVTPPGVALDVHPSHVIPQLHSRAAENTALFCMEFLATQYAMYPLAAPLQLSFHAVVGKAATEIIWLAAHLHADLIVMSTHAKGMKRLLLGSVAEKVVHGAGCPVFVTREKAHALSGHIPDIEPLCADCGSIREDTRGAQLWCKRHSEHHVRAGLVHRTASGPRAWSSSTGT